MPAGNWNPRHNLRWYTDSHGRRRRRVEWPKGPMQLNPNEIPTWVEAWVGQDSSGASQVSYQVSFGSRTRWNANKFRWMEGSFRRGPALGIALLSTKRRRGGQPAYFWWVEEITLR